MDDRTPKRFEETKTLLTEELSSTLPIPDQPFYAMRDSSNFGIGTSFFTIPQRNKQNESYLSKVKTNYTSQT